MGNKIALLCVNPWEGFLSPEYQSCGREYYERLQKEAGLLDPAMYCRECVEVYGEPFLGGNGEVFGDCGELFQLSYVQSGNVRMIEEVFRKADVVLMGLPLCKEEFDRIFMRIFPWKDQVKFLWYSHTHSEKEFVSKLCRRYKLHPAQILELQRDILT